MRARQQDPVWLANEAKRIDARVVAAATLTDTLRLALHQSTVLIDGMNSDDPALAGIEDARSWIENAIQAADPAPGAILDGLTQAMEDA